MSTILTSIALMCQINVGSGASITGDGQMTATVKLQRDCQRQLSKCILNSPAVNRGTGRVMDKNKLEFELLWCILQREGEKKP